MLPTSSPIPASSTNPNLAKGFDPSALIATGLTTVVDLLIKKNDAKKAAELQAKLEKLSLQQQQELEQKLRATTTEIGKYAILYKTLAINENNAVLQSLRATKNKNLILFFVGLITLSTIIIISRKK